MRDSSVFDFEQFLMDLLMIQFNALHIVTPIQRELSNSEKFLVHAKNMI